MITFFRCVAAFGLGYCADQFYRALRAWRSIAALEAQARTTAREARDRHDNTTVVITKSPMKKLDYFTRPIGALSSAEYNAWRRSYASIKLDGPTIHAASWAALMEDR